MTDRGLGMKRYIKLQVCDDEGDVVQEWGKGINIEYPEPGVVKKNINSLLRAVYWTLLKEYKLVEIVGITQEMADELYSDNMKQITRIDIIPVEELILSLKDMTLEEVAEKWWVKPDDVKLQLAELSHKLFVARREKDTGERR